MKAIPLRNALSNSPCPAGWILWEFSLGLKGGVVALWYGSVVGVRGRGKANIMEPNHGNSFTGAPAQG